MTLAQKIVQNLALIDLTNFCMENKIDCSGSHVVKYPKKYIYALVRDVDGLALATVSFFKNSVPVHSINRNK